MMLLKGVYNAKIKDIKDKIRCTTNLATNVNLNTKINGIKNKIPSIINLATTAVVNAKTNEFKNKIPNIINLANTTAVTAVETKTPDHSKHTTAPEVNSRTLFCKISTSKFGNQN